MSMLSSNKSFKWLKFVKGLFDRTGCTDIYINQSNISTTNTNIIIKRVLTDQFLQDWRNKLSSSNKGRQYNLFKDHVELETYLVKLPKQYVLPEYKFRTANHKFPIEKGRWSNIVYNKRMCHYCMSDIGDEFHYLLVCEHFKEKRDQYLKKYYYTRPNVIKYKELLNSQSFTVQKNLSIYISFLLKQIS